MHLILKFFLLREVKKFHMKSNQYPWGYKTKCKITLFSILSQTKVCFPIH